MRAAQIICTTAPGHHSLRRSGRAWALRLRLQRSVPGRGLGLVAWSQPEGLGAEERNVTAKGTQEEVWACRRSKVTLLVGSERRRGV